MQIMKALTAAVLLAGAIVPAHAAIGLARVRPDNVKQYGFKVEATRQENGLVRFEVAQDLSRVDPIVPRVATLRLNQEGTPTDRNLEPKRGKSAVTYTFRVAPDALKKSELRVQEGGGASYRGVVYMFQLADFVKAP
jgi:hypothetical protein